jgi:hypothetical protein
MSVRQSQNPIANSRRSLARAELAQGLDATKAKLQETSDKILSVSAATEVEVVGDQIHDAVAGDRPHSQLSEAVRLPRHG